MIENKKGESLVGIVIGILLLTFVILGLYNLIIYSQNTNINFEDNSIKGILQDNAQSISYKVNTDGILEGSGFYIWKDNSTKTFKVFTGTTNIKYKYIDRFGEFIDTGVIDTNIYTREVIIEKIDSATNSKIFKVNIGNYYKR